MLNNKIEDSGRALKEELNTALNEISRKMEEGNAKLNTRVDAEIAVVREEITEVNKKCEQHGQDLKRTREEVDGRIDNIEEMTEARIESLKRMSQDEIKQVRTDVGERCEEISASVDTVRTLTVANWEKIEELRQREIVQMREEIEVIRNRPIPVSYTHLDVYKRQVRIVHSYVVHQ